MSKGSDKRDHSRPLDPTTMEFPKRSPSVRPPPWLKGGETAVRTVDFRNPRQQDAAPPEPVITAEQRAAEAAKKAAEEAAAQALRAAEQKAKEEQRAQEELRQRAERLAQAITEATALRARILGETEGQLIELAVMIASAIVEREIEIDTDVHARLTQAALACLGPSDRATLRASKEAYALMVESHGGSSVQIEGVQVQIVCDATLSGFGFLVESADARVDARVQTRLTEVLEALRRERGRSSEAAA